MKNINEPIRDMITSYVRPRLFFVFNVVTKSKPEKRPILRNIDARDPKNFRRSMRKIIIDGDEIKIPAQTTHVTETRRYKGSSILISDLNFTYLSWSYAVRELNTPYFEWISYCYGNNLDFDYQVVICRHVWMMFETYIKLQKKRIRKNTIKILRSLTWLAVQSAVYKIKTDDDFYDRKTLAKLIEKSNTTWRENYSQYWQLLLNVCYKLDWESLINVDRKQRDHN